MHKLTISADDDFWINEKQLLGEIVFTSGELVLIQGENGIGKSSFLQYLKRKQTSLLKGKCIFVDQSRVMPLNDLSFKDAKKVFKPYQFEKLDIYSDYEQYILPYIDKPIGQLSGGQNQMIKIMLGLYLSGDIFFFDEPLQFLDQKNKKLFLELLTSLKKRDKAICIIEHNKKDLAHLIDTCFNLEISGMYLKLGAI
ncbi:MAG: ATP-binding cassette domain-containing protein [Halobacteriovoraceae bacterium]|jgi:lincosamide and streptogramin A transport system ATP-binding/permease protein|nr:ATP-binding cassette domain-containing protein [Halobacteriovoraceae bacterium]